MLSALLRGLQAAELCRLDCMLVEYINSAGLGLHGWNGG
jgi:hypothetical protein